jgi:hypothetical protein
MQRKMTRRTQRKQRSLYSRQGVALTSTGGRLRPPFLLTLAEQWGRWLQKNFDLTDRTAQRYLQWARVHDRNRHGVSEMPVSMRDMTGDRDRARERHQSTQQQAFRRVLHEVSRGDFVQERQARDDEVKLHRELAVELVDIGYRALATKLHPDRGGSKDAMGRLNLVRDELKQVAQTRRFV